MRKRTASTGTTVMLACLGTMGAVLAWSLSSTPLLMHLDWDNAFHLWQINDLLDAGPDDCGLGHTLWTCGYTAHMALEPLYGAGAGVVRALGGDTLQGMRAVNAAALAAAAVLLALTVHRIGAPAWAAVVVVVAWLGTADVLFLVRTLEDDCLSLAWMAGLLYWCTRARTRTTAVTALLGGAIVGAGALTNYPMIVWAPVAVAAAVCYARPDVPLTDSRRLLWGGAVLAGLIAAVALWGVWVHAYDAASWPWATYVRAVFTSPNAEVSGRDGSVAAFLRYVAVHPLNTVLPRDWYPWQLWQASTPGSAAVATVLGIAALAGLAWPLRHGVRRASAAGALVSLSCLALLVCTVPAAWKGDEAYYERMDHVPLCLAAIAGGLLAGWPAPRRLASGLLAAAVVAVPIVNAREVARTPRYASWLARFAAMRASGPRATTFVFAESEFEPGDFDKLTSLGVALPNHFVVSPDGAIRDWPFTPVHHLPVAQYLEDPPSAPRPSAAAAALIASGLAARRER